MSFLAGLCGCLTRSDTPPSVSPEMQSTHGQSRTRSGIQTGQFTFSDQGGFIHTACPRRGGQGAPLGNLEEGYASVVPLPQYTPRPMSIHEKTLETNMRDPPVSSRSAEYPHDEKSRNLYDDDVTSDSSSAFSYPSSYGNTSTATRETPPPPYSPRVSAVLSRSRSVSVSSAMAVTVHPPAVARVHGSRSGGPPSIADDQSIRRHRRLSWESR